MSCIPSELQDFTQYLYGGGMQVRVMLATICGRFRLELAPEMGGEAGVLEKQISSFTLAVDGGLHMYFHDRAKVPMLLDLSHSKPLCLSSTEPKV